MPCWRPRRGRQATGPAGVEGPEPEPAGGFQLFPEQPGDQESRQHVEDVHPDEPAPDPAQPGVVGHHRQDADPPQPFNVGPEPIHHAHGRPPNPTARA